jgi:hypothetical protein
MNWQKKLSLATLILAGAFIFIFRMTHVSQKEMSWDVLGYYLYLPATFIYDEPMLNNYDWLKKINEEKDLTGTYYQISSTPKGEPMYFFLMGMSYFYLPSFLTGHLIANLTNSPVDGFSAPYRYAMVVGGIIYTLIGLYFLRKILRRYFSEAITSLVILITVFGTNYIHHLTLDNLATVNVLFMLMTILVWNTIRWHEDFKPRNLIAAGIAVVLMGLVKPSEVMSILIFLLWNVTSWSDARNKIKIFWSQKMAILITLGICLVIVFPQILYWYLKTGYLLYDSYKNPGVGLDIFSPHIIQALFSYRKGWFLYTPVMIFAMIGFYFVFRNNRKIFLSLAGYWIVAFYIISSWSEWWYGAAYSNRALITTYPILAICLGYFLQYIQVQKAAIKMLFGVVVVLMIFLNQFQWWQLRHYILDPYRTTKEYYWATFLKTYKTEEDEALKKVERSFDGINRFKNEDKYVKRILDSESFGQLSGENILADPDSNFYYKMLENQEFSFTFKHKYFEFTDQDHAWLKSVIDVRYPEGYNGPWPCLVMSMEYKGKVYGYMANELRVEPMDKGWHHFEFYYLTPEIRRQRDVFKCYVWKRGRESYDIDNFQLELYTYKSEK